MKRHTKIKLAAALLVTGLVAAPVAATYAASGTHDRSHDRVMPGKDHHEGKHGGECAGRGDGGEHGKDGKFHSQARERVSPLSPDEARTLIDAMLLKTESVDLKTGDALMAEEPGKIDVLLVNAEGGVVDVIKFDAKTGRMDHGERLDLRKRMSHPDKTERFDRKFTADQMNTLANAMAIRFGNGALKLGELTQTERGTYMATLTNEAGDIVREMELSSVTGRPVS